MRLGVLLDHRVARTFSLRESAVFIANDEHPVYRAGDVLVRQEFDQAAAEFFARLFNSLPAQGFRVPRPIRSISGAYVADGGGRRGRSCKDGLRRPAIRQSSSRPLRRITRR